MKSPERLILLTWHRYGGKLLLSGEYTVVQFFIVYLAVIYCGEAAGQFLAFCNSIGKGQRACNEILSFRNQIPSIQEDPSLDEPELDTDKPAHIASDDVSYAYATRPNATVVKDATFEIKPGQFVAFVGPSGCGKSTLVALLSRFYDPVSGTISLDSYPIKALCPRQYRGQLALVQQEPVLYQGSIRENVAMGLSMAEASDEQVKSACEAANIHDFITSLPEGFNTLCGARGTQLSGGQRQRLAIARALIREPRLLLLDEATSALDTESERIVQGALEKAQSGRTTLAVAHRLSTIKEADLILVFERGRIVERGSHAQLLAKKGVYYEMCLGQSLDREAA
jgi:ATP-binding cassette, subfamily B (MDR/TAP), member 1